MFKECRHIMPSGRRCHAAALRDKPYCYFHLGLHLARQVATGKAPEMPPIEDTQGIQLALTQVIGALNSPFMDTRRAGLLLYGLQIAAQLAHRSAKSDTSKCERNPSEKDGNFLAPEKDACDRPHDCLTCRHTDYCANYVEMEEDEEEDLVYERDPDLDEEED